ncbi:hypothetical protein K0504_05670 [Neiella marina]|uniref:Uncharacterized protein n=1 Tax=Neiella holothuriorum TaxID=2870530 RepID=A0ABS7EDV5_9GAMM|nr:hypothetical protein [Neiella holothuriorum]MBW8190519.1 hypothetical protein [Neiella holothuriorum]
MSFRDLIFKEVLCAIILGSIPCFLIVQASGVDGLITFLEGIQPPDVIVWFFGALFVIHILLSGLAYFFYFPDLSIASFVRFIYGLSEQVGFSLQGVYRSMAGAIFFVAPPLLASEFNLASSVGTAVALTFAIACIFACTAFTFAQRSIAARVGRFL